MVVAEFEIARCASLSKNTYILINILIHNLQTMQSNLTFCFEKPGSTTYTMPSIVREVSAMFVLTTSFRPAGPPGYLGGGASLNMSCCCLGGREEYRGYTLRGPQVSPEEMQRVQVQRVQYR